MNTPFVFFFFFFLFVAGGRTDFVSMEPETFEERMETAKRILSEVPLIDAHNDLAISLHDIVHNRLKLFPFDKYLTEFEPWASDRYSQTDLPLLKEGMVAGQFWNAWVPCDLPTVDSVVQGLEQMDVIKRLIDKYPNNLQFADSTKGISDAFTKGKIASLIGVGGGHMFNSSLAVLRTFYNSGARYLTLTYACDTPWAESFFEPPYRKTGIKGLSDFGQLVIGEMNRLGMIVDLSHAADKTMKDVLDTTAAPVIFSHSSARALCNNTRNVPDDVLEKLKENGGIVMMAFSPMLLTCSQNASLYDVIDHLNHIRNVSGIDHVGLGSGFDGINIVPEGLENVSKYPNLFAELLLDPNWSEKDLKKLAGLNFMRAFKGVESVKEILSAEHPIEGSVHI